MTTTTRCGRERGRVIVKLEVEVAEGVAAVMATVSGLEGKKKRTGEMEKEEAEWVRKTRAQRNLEWRKKRGRGEAGRAGGGNGTRGHQREVLLMLF